MILTCIGTGTAAPESDRVCSGYLLDGHGLRILFDCGGGVVHGMARLGVAWPDLTHLVLTHFHNDHIGDVPLLFFALKHGLRPPREEPLTVIGPHGTRKLLHRMAELFGEHVSDPGFPVDVVELADGEDRRLAGVVSIRARKSRHTPESLAFRVEADSSSFCYTGDTGVSGDLAIFAQGADILLTECSVPDEEAMETHLSPAGVAEMARIALPKRLVLTHVYPQLDRTAVPGLVRTAGWPGSVAVPRDGEMFEL
ncbi:MAG TPA: MBL fold metallo-hydrolase [Longimicrobiales bacterium]|nr:MBL fold metallo-hydrolase [Longimicrobiales bacterium]